MERKDYELQISEIKNDILNEISDILGANARHDFKDTFYVHFIDGEVATTEVCTGVGTDGHLVELHVINASRGNEIIGVDMLHKFDVSSLLDVLCNLKKEILFGEKWNAVMTRSQAYVNSSAFSRAMEYIADNDWGLYVKLIELEYEEAFG